MARPSSIRDASTAADRRRRARAVSATTSARVGTAGGADARAYPRELRRHYPGCHTIWQLADRASAPTDRQTQTPAAALRIRFVCLPKQAPELTGMDQLWRELERVTAANRQAPTIAALVGEREAPGPDALADRSPPDGGPVVASLPAL